MSKIVQGVLMMRPNQIPNKETLAMLWAHEALRVFSDRLIDDDDRKYFGGMVVDSLKVQFKISKSYEDIFCSEQKLVFGDYTKMGVPRDDHKKKSSEYHSASRSGRLFSFSCRRKWRS